MSESLATGKKYHFAWDNLNDADMSDISVSSVHTSDLSSFEESSEDELPPQPRESTEDTTMESKQDTSSEQKESVSDGKCGVKASGLDGILKNIGYFIQVGPWICFIMA